ncbi:MAG: hypothetical protein DRJ60_00180 [Thermoprotei archaeon]|nr:MAG: hypothetical protein DRJ60_00180 [Thermoprotei archaeon]
MPREPAEDWIEKIRKELNEYEIGGYDLDQVFEPLFEACSKVAKTYSEFKQCVEEGISTLKSVVRKTRF